MYKGVEDTNIEAELTADLVGDYLFTDSDFVRHLSANNRNIFEKIFDEIKYLCKIATAGSKEARQLEKVKKVFEDMYRTETKNTATESGVRYALSSKKQPGTLDPRTITRQDVLDMLKLVQKESISGNTYIPIRIGTPSTLIYWANKRRGDVIDDNPIAISADKAYNAMNREGFTDAGKPNRLSADDIVAMVEHMNDPRYIVYQGANDRYVEVVEFNTESGDKAFAVIEIGNNKDAVYMNGYEGGLYNILVTTYPPRAGKLRELLKNSRNQVIYDKKKDAPQRTSGSTVPSVLNDASFYKDSIPEINEGVKQQYSISSADHDIAPVRGGIYSNDVLLQGEIGPVKDASAANNGKKLLKEDDAPAIMTEEASENPLTYDEEGSLLAYKSGGSYTINGKLRDGDSLSAYEQKIVDDLDSALMKLPIYHGKVYRNVVFDGFGDQTAVDDLLQSYVIGETVHHRAYTSASTQQDGYPVKGQFVVHYEIESVNGRDMQGYGNNAESEVLIPRNTEFMVDDIRYDEGGTPTIYLTEMVNSEEGIYAGGNRSDRARSFSGGQDLRIRESATPDMQRLPAPDPADGEMHPLSMQHTTRGFGYREMRGIQTEAERTDTEQIAPIPETPSNDGVFFDGDIGPVVQSESPLEDIGPVREDVMPTKTAEVLVDEPVIQKKRRGLWSWVKEQVFDKGMVFESLAKKAKNRELEAKWKMNETTPDGNYPAGRFSFLFYPSPEQRDDRTDTKQDTVDRHHRRPGREVE